MNKFFGWRGFLMMALMAIPYFIIPTPAKAALSITPLIGFFEGRQRYIDVNLINSGEDEQDYEIKWRFYKMIEETGLYENSEGSVTDWDLTKHLVYTPKRLSLRANEFQRVRLALRLDGEPPAPGDYRGHLEFKEVGKNIPPQTPSEENNEKGAEIGISMKVGFSIPIIYRVGESTAVAKIGDVKTQINPNSGAIEAVIDVTKNESPFGILGHMLIYYGDTVIGEVKNGNIFPEITKRRFVVPLTTKNLTSGALRVVYKDYNPENKTIYDEKTVQIGK